MNYPKNRYTGPKPWMDYDWLYNEYVIKDRSTQDIADEFGCKQNTIQCWLLKHNIKKDLTPKHHTYDYLYHNYIELHKTKEEIAKESRVNVEVISQYLRENNIPQWDYKGHNQDPYSAEQTQDIIYRYTVLNQSSPQIALVYGVSHRSILQCLRRNNVPRRTLSESQFAYNGKPFISALSDKELLQELHWGQHLSCAEIGRQLGCDPDTVRRHMNALGIRTRNNSESKLGVMTGENHPNWQGGITPLHILLRGYFHTNLAPIAAASRDNYTCCGCGKTHTILHVHHIYPFSQIMKDIYNRYPNLDPTDLKDRQTLYNIAINDSKFLDIDNLQTLCVSCHIKKHSKTISNQADIIKSEGSETIP